MMAINARTLALLDSRREQLSKIDAAQMLNLVTAYVQAWDKLRPEYEAALAELMTAAKDGRVTQSQVAHSRRLQQALEITRDELVLLGELTNKTITADIPTMLGIAGSSQVEIIASQLPANETSIVVDWVRVNRDTLAAIIERTTDRIEKATNPLPDEIQTVMKRELVRGIAVGDNPRATARRIVQQSEGRFNGGLTRAMNIARTETISAHNTAAFEADQANADIMEKWSWGASLSARTCPACLSRHGTEYPITTPGPLSHQSCRCTRIPVTKSWSDLGFEGITEPPSLMEDSESWFNGLTAGTQRNILGPERLKLYDDGTIKWGDLSRVQQNPGWRQSVVVTPIKDLRKAA